MTYYATEKRKGKQWGLAAWEPDTDDTCLALADEVFSFHGIAARASWASITKQKNWAGMLPNAPIYRDTADQARLYADQRRSREYARMGIQPTL